MFFSYTDASFLKRENSKNTLALNTLSTQTTQHGEHIYVLNDNNMTTFKHAIMSDG